MTRTIIVDQQTALPSSLQDWALDVRKRFDCLVHEKLTDHRYQHGIWSVAYSLTGSLHSPAPDEFLEMLHQVRGHESGWPPWWVPTREPIAPYSVDGELECWLKDSILGDGVFGDPAYSDFWRASPKARMYLARGYQEDSVEGLAPGMMLSLTSPIRRVGEVLLHASRLAVALGDRQAATSVWLRWEGLAGRELTPWPSYRRLIWEEHVCRVAQVTNEIKTSADEVNRDLAGLVQKVTGPLYDAFSFQLRPSMFEEELGELVRNRF